jgi:hypothetical protein
MVYVHPILGILTVVLVCWLAIHGLRARHPAAYAPDSRRLHNRASRWILGLWALTLSAGWASTALLRDDLPAGRTAHFVVAWVGLALFTTSWWLSRRFGRSPASRRVHPWLGLGGVGCALVLAILGMGLLP